jgi:hypothetical protein
VVEGKGDGSGVGLGPSELEVVVERTVDVSD